MSDINNIYLGFHKNKNIINNFRLQNIFSSIFEINTCLPNLPNTPNTPNIPNTPNKKVTFSNDNKTYYINNNNNNNNNDKSNFYSPTDYYIFRCEYLNEIQKIMYIKNISYVEAKKVLYQ